MYECPVLCYFCSHLSGRVPCNILFRFPVRVPLLELLYHQWLFHQADTKPSNINMPETNVCFPFVVCTSRSNQCRSPSCHGPNTCANLPTVARMFSLAKRKGFTMPHATAVQAE